jgi:hypothetical protein
MSNCGIEALLWPGDPLDELLALPAKVPPLALNVGYPAGKLVVKPGRLVMVRPVIAAKKEY